MDKNAKLLEIFENEQFKAAAEEVASVEDLQKLFAKHGLELTQDEINNLCAHAVKCMKEDELGEEDLEDVAGGISGISFALTGAKVIRWLVKNPRIRDLLKL